MSKFQANGFEVDDEDPTIPLTAVMKLRENIDGCGAMCDFFFSQWLDELGIPMHILANALQEIGE